ncbi:MAG: hypothetical protein EHM70_18240, partial [Chloroflexota bacterium]
MATVRKSLEQLKQIELYPFFAVTGYATGAEASTDGLLTSHIRYQGFQGNIRRTTKPVSLDQDAFSKLISLDPFATWRENGGVMVSDELGSRAVRRFYESSGQVFTTRFVARDAFMAGNDLLYLGNFSTADEPDPYINIVRTIDFFTQRYRDDSVFAQRVDESVLRILTLKYRIYNNTFTLTQAAPPAEVPTFLGASNQVSFEVIKQGATLINPDQEELASSMPNPPGRNDNIVFLTDVRFGQQCSYCPVQRILAEDSLQKVVVRLYSPQAGGQVLPSHLTSYSFEDLQEMLDVGPNVVQIDNDLRQAQWIVFLMLNETQDLPTSLALRHFLDLRPDLYQGKNLIVFSLNAPYFLDATDIYKLTAYYALYTKALQSLDVAARLLFQDIRATGSLPVSVPGIAYDLNTATFPDPDQNIQVLLD